ncbi:MAG TPA: hypothetical protein VFN67_07360 [Polyangiales bacterium]|nr:hypothetical protein [Polyangiales bacterium]
MGLGVSACSEPMPLPASTESPPPDQSQEVSATGCPELDDAPDGKIFHEAYLRDHAPAAERVSVWLRAAKFPEVAPCDGSVNAREVGCTERDPALTQRAAINARQLECVLLDGFAFRGAAQAGGELQPVYWEEPFHDSSGEPVPIMLAFETTVTLELAERLARHPYVSRIEPALGSVASLGIAAPAAPADCPKQREAATGKLTNSTAPDWKDRQSVAIGLLVDGYLPPAVECPDKQPSCEAWTVAEWDRYLLNRRAQSCVLRHIDQNTVAGEGPTSFAAISGSPLTRGIPPWGTIPSVLLEFGRNLTWAEAQQVSAHPFVASIRHVPASSTTPVDGCPIDPKQPVAKPECTQERDGGRKWSQRSEAEWSAAPGPIRVLLAINGGHMSCGAPDCPPRPNPCPEQEAVQMFLEEWNWQSQRCVRALIQELGGTATDERFWLVDTMVAELTWAQIQEVAKHPHVRTIESSLSSPPP